MSWKDELSIEKSTKLLSPTRSCAKHNFVRKKKTIYYEKAHILQNSTVMSNLIRNLESKLGVDNGYLSHEDLMLLYDLCRYHLAWFPKEHSVWCALFTPHELKLIEYQEDQWYWLKYSYGHDINRKLASQLVGDIVESLESATTSFLFGRSEALVNLITTLEMFYNPSDFENFEDSFANRSFELSKISPFSGSLGFALYSCGNSRKKVVMFHNEKPMTIPLCNNTLRYCDWNVFKQQHSHLINHDHQNFCKLNNSDCN